MALVIKLFFYRGQAESFKSKSCVSIGKHAGGCIMLQGRFVKDGNAEKRQA